MTATEQQKTGGSLARRIARNMISRSARHFVSALVVRMLRKVCRKVRGGYSWQ